MKPLSRRLYAIAALVLSVVIFVCVNIAADIGITSTRLDLTETGQFTLSKGTRNIVAKIPEPITLKFYFSKKSAADLAPVQSYATRVRDLLQEYASLSHGKIVLQEIDPEPFSAAEDEATASGITGIPLDNGDQLYFGLVASNRIDGKEAIAYFASDREPYLELDISTLIYDLSQPHKDVLGVISGLPLDGGGPQAFSGGGGQPNVIYASLSQTYTTQMLDPSANQIPSGVSVLMVVHPTNLSAAALYAIDQFVLKGGHALIFVDPNSGLAQTGGGMDPRGGVQPMSDLPTLFRAWGVAYVPNKVVADRDLARQVRIANDPVSPVVSYPAWIHLTKTQFNQSDIVTSSMQSLNLATVGALYPIKGSTTQFETLIHSSENAGLLDADSINFVPPQDLLGAVHPTGESYVIAARITGPAKTAFPSGPPAPLTVAGQPPPPPLPPQVKQSTDDHPVNVIVMADTDIFQDRFWVDVQDLFGKQILKPSADNAAFVLNAVENLMGSSDLISLRTRASNDRPFTRVEAMQADAQAKLLARAQMLQADLAKYKQQLHDMEQSGGTQTGQAPGATPAQQKAVEVVRRALVDTRTQLRDVQHDLRKDVDALGAVLAFLNIALVPILIILYAGVRALLRRKVPPVEIALIAGIVVLFVAAALAAPFGLTLRIASAVGGWLLLFTLLLRRQRGAGPARQP